MAIAIARQKKQATYLGHFATSLVSLDHRFDHTNGNRLSHVTNGKSSKRWIVGKGFHTHGLGRNHLDNGSIARLDELRSVFNRLARTTINLFENFGKLAGNVSGMAIEHRSIASSNLTGMVENDDLGVEGFGTFGRIVLGVARHIATTDFLDGHVLDVEADIITGKTFDQLFMVHFHRFDFGRHISRSERDHHPRLDDSGFHTTHRHRTNTTNLVDILKGKTQWLVGRTRRRIDGINGFQQRFAGRLSLGLLFPAFVPGAIGRDVNHVVAIEAGNGNEWNGLGIVADLLDEVGNLLDDFVETILGPFGGIHLVDSHNQLPDTKGIGQECVFARLTILGDTSLEFTSTSSDDENGAISLRSTGNHVLDEITMTGSVWFCG